MADNVQKIPYLRSSNDFAEKKVLDALQLLGKELPCSVVALGTPPMVTLKFEVDAAPFTLPQVTCPQAMSQWAREPTQLGDKGYVLPGATYLGGVSGLGGGTANLVQRANLSALVFHPISTTSFSTVDPNAYVLNGPNGVVIRDTASKTVITLTPGGITIVCQDGDAVTLTGDLIVKGKITATEDIIAGQGGINISLSDHIHAGVTAGTDSTDPPTSNT